MAIQSPVAHSGHSFDPAAAETLLAPNARLSGMAVRWLSVVLRIVASFGGAEVSVRRLFVSEVRGKGTHGVLLLRVLI